MSLRILGIDPGLTRTGWGVISVEGAHLSAIACGAISTLAADATPLRLQILADGLRRVMELWRPHVAAVEETFVNQNPASTLKLGHARGIALLIPAEAGLKVHEYAANLVKKSVTGQGHASKEQVQHMVRHLLPTAVLDSADAADAYAVALCHAHHAATGDRVQAALQKERRR